MVCTSPRKAGPSLPEWVLLNKLPTKVSMARRAQVGLREGVLEVKFVTSAVGFLFSLGRTTRTMQVGPPMWKRTTLHFMARA